MRPWRWLVGLALFGAMPLKACELAAIPASELRFGCGCSYYFSQPAPLPPRIVLQTDLQGLQPIMMRQGQLVSLWGARPSALLSHQNLVKTQQFRYQDQAIILQSRLRPACEFGKAGCEVLTYLTRISSYQNYQQCEWVLQADCGC
ncbi:hypothetical protein [Agarivorans gilvus]|jgi:hypothetical protein|uniref:Uncharacterized protein n=1 Tax=Agarivorans gilvus TaxID=680279 RepID=A0ABQ1HZZ9_9ALTE|nr:hypothetical protein [Agarivorans gilvus]GGA99698.1 hypothetical protein GCM10007414_10960 [Agarivorans gilvus]